MDFPVVEFDIKEAVISDMRTRYLALTIKGLDDKDGYAAVHTARMEVKGLRVKITKRGKELRDAANNYNRTVLDEEKRLIGMIEPIELHLEFEEKAIDAEKERIKREAAEAAARKIKARADKLFALGMSFNGVEYVGYQASATPENIASASDDQFDTLCRWIETNKAEAEEADRKRREEEERVRLENERLSRELEEAKQAKEKAEAEAKALVDAEANRIAEEARKAREQAEAAKMAQELDNERRKAAEKALKDKADAEERERKAAERKAARAPDKEKLLALALTLDAVKYPEVKSEEAKEILIWIGQTMMAATKEMRRRAQEL